jgi:hypothetical protein
MHLGNDDRADGAARLMASQYLHSADTKKDGATCAIPIHNNGALRGSADILMSRLLFF